MEHAVSLTLDQIVLQHVLQARGHRDESTQLLLDQCLVHDLKGGMSG